MVAVLVKMTVNKTAMPRKEQHAQLKAAAASRTST
jgi:hypothetical protein